MRKVIVSMFVTLDGFIAGPNGELDWMPGNAKPNKEVDTHIYRFLDTVDTVLLGHTTYELFVGFWPSATIDEDISADKLNAIPKIVFSSTLEKVEWGKWNNARLVKQEAKEEILKLKNQPGKDMVIFGGANLVQSFTNMGLIDEYQLLVVPIILGGGKPLFRNIRSRVNLRLLETKAFKSGTALLTYSLE